MTPATGATGKGHLLNAAKLSVSMIQRRDDMKQLLGYSYDGQVGAARTIMRNKAKAERKDIAAVALEMAKKMDREGHDPSIVIAALVDECESLGGAHAE